MVDTCIIMGRPRHCPPAQGIIYVLFMCKSNPSRMFQFARQLPLFVPFRVTASDVWVVTQCDALKRCVRVLITTVALACVLPLWKRSVHLFIVQEVMQKMPPLRIPFNGRHDTPQALTTTYVV